MRCFRVVCLPREQPATIIADRFELREDHVLLWEDQRLVAKIPMREVTFLGETVVSSEDVRDRTQ